MSEAPSLRMEQINDELNERPLKGTLFQRLGRALLSVRFTSRAGSQDPPPSHNGHSVVPSTMPGTFPGSNHSRSDQTADDKSGQLGRVEGRSGLHKISGDSGSGKGVGEKFDKYGSDDEDDKGDDYDPPWLQHETSPPLSLYNAAHFCREYGDRLRSDSTSYPQTEGADLLNGTKSNH
jgi:hypothetical protein